MSVWKLSYSLFALYNTSLLQSNQALRHGYVLSREQLQVLMQIGQGELTDPDRKELIQKVNTLLKVKVVVTWVSQSWIYMPVP